ncbi:predicted protein [Nematostella vectensis]|uniref:Peptidase S72 domain-containing protein n=1 Tax=Nematostella vectensis TaxID=45351 RepID=A7SEJ6_NEMVE|nr:predicted protein [Nematostella vectensis]|eukprot:XP_001629952.1 predicted protein [Nematostella vectensis]
MPTPLLLKPLDQLAAFIGQAFLFKVPDDTFYPTYNAESSSNLRLTMYTKNGGEISKTSWIQFEPSSRNVYGFPLPGNKGVFKFLVSATNQRGQSAKDFMEVDIKENTGQYNHEFVINTDFNLVSFMADVLVRFEFVSRVGRYIANEDISSVWLKSFNQDTREVTISLNTVPYAPCNKPKLKRLLTRFVSDTGAVNQNFQTAMSEKFPVSSVKMNYLGICLEEENADNVGFDWGWLRHVLPLFMLIGVVGIPVGISCIIGKIARKRRLARQGRRKREENGMGFTFHTVHFNNRYPSMLSMSNNSKEDEGNDELNLNSNLRVNIPNGSPPAATHLAVLNANQKQQNTLNAEKEKNTPKSKVVYMGKSDLNIPVYFTQPKLEEDNPLIDINFAELAESISSKLKGFGKSVMNVAGVAENDVNTMQETKTVIEGDLVAFESEIRIPAPGEEPSGSMAGIQRLMSTGRSRRMAKRSQSEVRLNEHAFYEENLDYKSIKFVGLPNIKGTLMSPVKSRMPSRRLSMPHIGFGDHGQDLGLVLETPTKPAKPLKSALKKNSPVSRLSNLTDSIIGMAANGDSIGQYTGYIEQLSQNARQEFGSNLETGYHTEATPNIEAVPHESPKEPATYYRPKEAGIDPYGAHAHSDVCEEYEYEESSVEDPEELEVMDYTTWRLKQIRKAERQEKRIPHEEYDEADPDDPEYEDYTNPYHYTNGPLRPPVRSQSSYGLLERSKSPSEFPSDWTSDYEKENRYKQQPPETNHHNHVTQSMPGGLDQKGHQGIMGNHTGSKVDNSDGATSKENKSFLGSMFFREKPSVDQNVNQATSDGDGSVVGFLKTSLTGFLGPSSSEGTSSSAASRWFK